MKAYIQARTTKYYRASANSNTIGTNSVEQRLCQTSLHTRLVHARVVRMNCCVKIIKNNHTRLHLVDVTAHYTLYEQQELTTKLSYTDMTALCTKRRNTVNGYFYNLIILIVKQLC